MKHFYILLLTCLWLMLLSSKSMAQLSRPQLPALATEGDVLIFVSFSMPEKSLQQWFEQAKRIRAPLVLRGLINDSLQDTQSRLTHFISLEEASDHEEESTGVTIDPRLFTEYGITRVPAVVVRDTKKACLEDIGCPQTYSFDVVYGDVGLDAALRKIVGEKNGAISQVAKNLLEAGRGRT